MLFGLVFLISGGIGLFYTNTNLIAWSTMWVFGNLTMKRFKRILKWTGIILGGLVAVGLVANAVFVRITDAQLQRQLAAIRKADDPLTLAELAPKPIRLLIDRHIMSPVGRGSHSAHPGILSDYSTHRLLVYHAPAVRASAAPTCSSLRSSHRTSARRPRC